MDVITRYGADTLLYEFEPQHQIQIRDNFRNVVPRTSRLPGLDGGYDELGSAAAPSEVGNIQLTFWLHGRNLNDMNQKKRDLGRMKAFGVQRLYKQPVDPEATELYCDARINSIDYNENASARPFERLQVTINWQVASPYWLAQGTESATWGGGVSWGGGALWGGGAAGQVVSGTQTDFVITPQGNASTFPRIEIATGASETAQNVTVQRLVGSLVVDEVKYTATLNNSQSLLINCRALSVTLDGANAYGDTYDFQNAGWFRLLPGANNIRVVMANASDAATIYFRYLERYV